MLKYCVSSICVWKRPKKNINSAKNFEKHIKSRTPLKLNEWIQQSERSVCGLVSIEIVGSRISPIIDGNWEDGIVWCIHCKIFACIHSLMQNNTYIEHKQASIEANMYAYGHIQWTVITCDTVDACALWVLTQAKK